MTTFVLAGLYYFIKKRYLGLIISILLISWIRFGSIVFLAVGIIIMMIYQMKKSKYFYLKIFLLMLIVISFFILAFPVIQEYSGDRLSNTLIRDTSGDYFGESTIAKLVNLPFPINIISSTAFFIYIPLLKFPTPVDGHFYSGDLMQGTLSPLFFFFIWNYFYNALFTLFLNKNGRNKSLAILFVLMIAFALLLGTVSLQSRHKTVLIPFLCLFSSYGIVRYNKNGQGSSVFLSACTIVFQLFYALYTW